jgi:hypothetical protein
MLYSPPQPKTQAALLSKHAAPSLSYLHTGPVQPTPIRVRLKQ